jgi:pyruvate dehydrogenase E2 component (dihydrolipoamide acetyltransferase)
LTLSADHRVIDGVTAAEFLRTLKELLEEPAMMMA